MEQLAELLAPFALPIQILIVLPGSVSSAKVIELTGRWIAPSIEPTTGSVRRVILREIYVPLYLSVFLYGLFLSLELIGAPILRFFESVILSAIVVLWTRAGIRAGSNSLEEIKEGDTHYEFAPVFKNLWSAAVVVIAAIALLLVWNIDITPLLASAGVFGIVLGLQPKRRSRTSSVESLSTLMIHTRSVISLFLSRARRAPSAILESGVRHCSHPIGC